MSRGCLKAKGASFSTTWRIAKSGIGERLARTAPDTLQCPEVARALELEQQLVHAMIMCLTEDTPGERAPPVISMRR